MASGIRRSGKPTMDIGEAFFSSKRTGTFSGEPLFRDSPPEIVLPHSSAEFRNQGPTPLRSGFLLELQDLAALVHAGLQIEVMRTAQFAGILVLGIGRLLQRIRRAAHATPRGRCFSTGNGHVGVL